MLGTYGSLVLVLAGAAAVGQGLARLAGRRGFWWPGPAVGLAALIAVASIAIKAPGGPTTAAVLCVLLVLAGAVLALRSGAPRGELLGAAALCGGSVAISSIPFAAREHLGLLGVSVNNDTASHLIWIQTLGSEAVARYHVLPSGYPLGPHSLMAALGKLDGARADELVNAFLLAAPALTVLAAYGILTWLGRVRRVLAAALVAFTYMLAAYYGQGAFKETLQALFLVAFVAGLRELGAVEPGKRLRLAVVLALLPAASVYTYSYLGLAWYVATLGLWLAAGAAAALLNGSPLTRVLRPGIAPALAAAGVCALALLPEIARLRRFFEGGVGLSVSGSGGIPATDVGNLGGPLSPYESLGLWPVGDFRLHPLDVFQSGQLSALGLAVLVYGVIWWLRRGDRAPLAAAAAGAVIWLYCKHSGQSPYVTAKSLVLMSPFLMLLSAGALLSFVPAAWGVRALHVAAAALFVGAAAWSSSVALRFSEVAAPDQADQLRALRPLVDDGPILFMGMDDYAASALPDLSFSYHSEVSFETASPVAVRDSKPRAYGQPLDWDNFPAAELDRFTYVITPRSGHDSSAPPNFQLVRQTAQFEAYKRTGPTEPRETVEGGEAAGGILNCRKYKLLGAAGVAEVRDPPALADIGVIPRGARYDAKLTLAPGPWVLSLNYLGPEALNIVVGDKTFHLPPYLGRPGPYFEIGQIESTGGEVTVQIHAVQPNRLSSPFDSTNLSTIAADRPSGQQVPLAQACGKWVDWYRVAS